MIRYFIRHYWRYLAMALAFATISFLASSCEVHASNTISSITLNYNDTSTSEWQSMYSSNNNNWANFGRGKLIFTTLVYKDSPNTTFDVPGLVGIYVYSGSNLFTCTTGSVSINEQDYDYIKGYMLNVVCDVNMGERGITQIVAQFETNSQNSWTTKTSYYMTFVSDLTLNNTQIIQEQDAYTRDVINNATNLINQTNTNLVTNILNAININHNNMYNLILSKLNDTNAKLDEIIAQNEVCNTINNSSIKTNDKGLTQSGIENTLNNGGITDYIKIDKNTKIKPLVNGGWATFSCFYNGNKALINCIQNNQYTINTNLTIPNNAEYIRFTIENNNNRPQFSICKTGNQAIADQNEEIINSQKETNDTLKDSSVDDPDSDLEDMQENEISNSVISDLLLLPINMFENIIDAISGTCSSFPLGALFGTTLSLPCIDIPSLIGSSLWSVIDVLFCGIFVLSIRKKFVDIFENITSLKDRGNELE